MQIELDNTLSDLLRIGAAGDGSLLIGDNVTLDLVSLGNPFALPRGTMFDIFDAGSVTGQFSQINFPAGAQFWDTSALYTSGQLIANVPEPSRAILLLAGLAFSLTRRRR
ncbi:MAG: PEP-CTERM sorting domain-containing protein [Verrucomicrobiales bacterium]